MAENERNPMWKQKNMQLDETVKLTLESSRSIANGMSKFGPWELWAVNVKNQTVLKDNKPVENYSGKAVMFPSDKLREKFLQATGGNNENTVIELTKRAKTSERGSLYTDYEIKVIEEGSPAIVDNAPNPFMTGESQSEDLNSVEQKLLNDAMDAKKQAEASGDTFTKEQFIQCAESSFNVKKERAEEIFEKNME